MTVRDARELNADADEQRARVARAQRARDIVNDEIFTEAVQGIKDHFYAEWCAAPLRDMEGMQQLRIMHDMVDRLVADLTKAMEDGKVAEVRLAETMTALDRLKRVVGLVPR